MPLGTLFSNFDYVQLIALMQFSSMLTQIHKRVSVSFEKANITKGTVPDVFLRTDSRNYTRASVRMFTTSGTLEQKSVEKARNRELRITSPAALLARPRVRL